MKLTSNIKRTFFSQYIVKELPKSDIMNNMGLTDRQYVKLVQIAKEMDKMSLDTEFMETIIKRRLIVDPDDSEALSAARDIWKSKHKVPSSSSILDFEV